MAVTEKKGEKKIIDVNSRMSDEEVVALDAKGYQLRFSEKDFREMGEDSLAKLGHANQRDYWIAKGAAGAIAKSKKRAEDGFGGIEVIADPFRSKPQRKMLMLNLPKGWVGVWKRPDEVAEWKAMGAKLVSEEVKTPNASTGSTSRTIAAKDGKDDLVAMMIPERLHVQHLQANSILSRRRAGATLKEVAGLVAKAEKHLESVVDLPGVTEETTTEEVPIREDMRRT